MMLIPSSTHEDQTSKRAKAWLRQLAASPSSSRTRPSPMAVYVGFVVNRVAGFSLSTLLFQSASFHQCSKILH